MQTRDAPDASPRGQPRQVDGPANTPAIETAGAAAAPECHAAPPVAQRQALLDNVPYLVMLLTGAAVFWLSVARGRWRWLPPAAYVLYGLAGVLWIIYFVCPYCHFYATRLCPCGYGQVAPRLRARQAGADFAGQFRRHIPVIVPLWFAPVIVGAVALWRGFSAALVAVLLAFLINSFVILPLVSRAYGCARCPQKQTCPWMGGCK